MVFPTGWDSATFRDKGTEVTSLSWDKGTTGQAENLAMGQNRPGQLLSKSVEAANFNGAPKVYQLF